MLMDANHTQSFPAIPPSGAVDLRGPRISGWPDVRGAIETRCGPIQRNTRCEAGSGIAAMTVAAEPLSRAPPASADNA